MIVEPGDYTASGTHLTLQISIHGVDGRPRPQINFTGSGLLELGDPGASARHLGIESPNAGLTVEPGTTADDVIAHSTGTDGCRVYGTLTNSVCWATGTNGNGLDAEIGSDRTLVLRNDTFIATGSNGNGMFLDTETGHNLTTTASNVIARGPAEDIEQKSTGAGSANTLNIDHSNYSAWLADPSGGAPAPTINSTAHQTLAPLFRDAASGDFHEAPGSPTIDAGASDPLNGTRDIDGDPRVDGAATDIGADEFIVPPAATTGAASGVTTNAATLNASVDPLGAPTTYHFEYGTTSAYGSATPEQSAGSAGGAHAVTAAVGGLAPGTTYHFRIVATDSGGTSAGTDATFTTSALVLPPPPDLFAGVRLRRQTVAVKGGRATVELTCPKGTPPPCRGKLTLRAKRRTARHRTATVTLGAANFRISPGATAKVRVKLSRKARRLLAAHHKLSSRAIVTATDGAGTTKLTTAPVTLKLRR